MKFRLALIAFGMLLLLMLPAVVALAQEELPEPYAGLKNPFPWDDDAAQQAGKQIYTRSCQGCHGITGANIPAFDFSASVYPDTLEARPDYYFWIVSEGRLGKGMPPFKSSLSDEQRWQLLTYLWSLSASGAVPEEPPAAAPADGIMTLAVLGESPSNQPLTLTATLKDKQGNPVANTVVKFLAGVDFFVSGLMELGDSTTDARGIATFEFLPRITGDTRIVARANGIEATSTINLVDTGDVFYHPEAGMHIPAPGPEVFIGPESSKGLGEGGTAPFPAFRLPGGVLSWLLVVIFTIALIWFTYFRVMYQVFRIPIMSDIAEDNPRLVPMIGMAIVFSLGILLLLMFTTGPYSHFHLGIGH